MKRPTRYASLVEAMQATECPANAGEGMPCQGCGCSAFARYRRCKSADAFRFICQHVDARGDELGDVETLSSVEQLKIRLAGPDPRDADELRLAKGGA